VALLAQLLLLGMVLVALAVKRHQERPRRPWTIWLLDISKQGFSSGAGHAVGMAVAIIASSTSGGGTSQCGWYFVVYLMDATMGMSLAILFHHIATAWAARLLLQANKDELRDGHWWQALAEVGHYGMDPAAPNLRTWGVQVVEWMSCVVLARTIVGCCVVLLIPLLRIVSSFMDRQFKGRPDVYLLTVMVCIPLVLNVGLAYIQDQVLKWKHGSGVGRKASTMGPSPTKRAAPLDYLGHDVGNSEPVDHCVAVQPQPFSGGHQTQRSSRPQGCSA